MALRHLPTPIIVPFLFLCAVVTFDYAIKIRFKENNRMVMGYYFLGIAFGYMGFAKLFMQKYQDVSVMIMAILLFTGFCLLASGALKKFKDDPIRRRQLLLCIYVMLFCIGFLALFFLSTIV